MIGDYADIPLGVWVVHLLLFPLYQTVGTIKHEGAHALAAIYAGFDIQRFVFWPQRDLGTFTWGYVLFGMDGPDGPIPVKVPRYVRLMPYYVDVVWYAVGILLSRLIDIEGTIAFWRVGLLVTFMVLPVVDVMYNAGKWIFFKRGDFADAFGGMSYGA